MKTNLFLLFLVLALNAESQNQLSEISLYNLAALGTMAAVNPTDNEDYFRKLDSLRTPELNPIVDGLIAMGHADTSVIQVRFLARPADQELVWWYIIYQLRGDDAPATKEAQLKLIKEELVADHDTNLLLHNYYYLLHGSISMLFNEADLSDYNYDMEKLGFKNDTEKAIFFFGFTKSFTERFLVLGMMKNLSKLNEFAKRMPLINDHQYYYYTNFDYPDFEWDDDGKKSTFNTVYIGKYYSVLITHMNALAEDDKKEAARILYYKSILNMPAYYKYSNAEKDLKAMYKEMN